MTNFSYSLGWDGKPLFGTHDQCVAFDCETSIDNMLDVSIMNKLALIQISNGERTVLIHPDQCAEFVTKHLDIPMVGHNISYDFWIIAHHLKLNGYETLLKSWWERVGKGLFHDSMIVDMLVRLANGDGENNGDDKFYPRGLGDVSKDYSGIVLNKQDPYRKRYGEIIGKKFSEIDDTGFWDYAAKDAYATYYTWIPLYKRALSISNRFAYGYSQGGNGKEILDRWLQYGVLTEQVQIKGAIALAEIERNGMPYDPKRAKDDEKRFRPIVESAVKELNKIRPALFKRKNGRMEMSKKSKVPQISDAELTIALSEAGTKIKEKIPEFQPPQSSGKKFRETGDAISKSAADWEGYAEHDSFLKSWIALSECVKRLGFYATFEDPDETLFSEFNKRTEYRIRSGYNLLMRTGRTSCKSIGSFSCNFQQLPRDPTFRGIFKTNKKLLTVDYSFIELVTLAATCINTFGYSKLGDVIKAGIDPHAFVASMFKEMSLEDFMKLKETDRDTFKLARQQAKAVGFGVPGGLGDIKLSAYAAANYGVNLSIKQAGEFRRKLINDIYPELNDRDGYLSDDTYKNIALNTGLSKGEVVTLLPGNSQMKSWLGRVLFRIASGATCKTSGDSYDPDFFEHCWDFLQAIGAKAPHNGPLSELSRKKLALRKGDSLLARELTSGYGTTLTGRIRGRVRYTISKNNPFQGLAGDGAKLALFELTKMGYKICAFVHDEIVVELEEEGAEEHAKTVNDIMKSSMKSVLNTDLPVGTEYHLGEDWSK